MKKFLEQFKPTNDEMGKEIENKSLRYAYYFLIFGLFFWSFGSSMYSIWSQGESGPEMFPLFLLIGAVWVQVIAQIVLRKRATAGDEEYREDYSLKKTLLYLLVFVLAAFAIGVAVRILTIVMIAR